MKPRIENRSPRPAAVASQRSVRGIGKKVAVPSSKRLSRLRTPAAIPKLFALVIAAMLLGCATKDQPERSAAPEVPYVGGAELDQLVTAPEGATLLEFCVPVGCYRCDEMRPSINDFAQEEAGRLTVRRVDLNDERQFAARHGVTVCPTYVVFRDGEEVYRAAYPTSADLIASAVDDSLSGASSRELSRAVR